MGRQKVRPAAIVWFTTLINLITGTISLQAQSMRIEPSLTGGSSYTHETLTLANQKTTAESQILFAQAQTLWSGTLAQMQMSGELGLGLSRSKQAKSEDISLSHTMESTSNQTWLTRVSVNGRLSRSEGFNNLNLSERIDRNRQIELLNGVAPLTLNPENQLVNRDLSANATILHRLTRTFTLGVEGIRSESSLQNELRSPTITQRTNLQTLAGLIDWQMTARLQISARVAASETQFRNQINASVAGGPASILIIQQERSHNGAIGWRLSGTNIWELTYLSITTETNTLAASQASGPGLRWRFQPARRWESITEIQRLRVKLDDREEFESEYGSMTMNYQISEDERFSLGASKNLDTAQVNFNLLTDNQIALEQRRNAIIQANMSLSRTYQRQQWISSWTYFEFETEQRNPSYFEHNLSQQLNWQLKTRRLWLLAADARRIVSRDQEAPSSIDIIGMYTGLEQQFRPMNRSERGGFIRFLLRGEQSLDKLTDAKLRRYSLNLAGGYNF